jgi:hypothetical protein
LRSDDSSGEDDSADAAPSAIVISGFGASTTVALIGLSTSLKLLRSDCTERRLAAMLQQKRHRHKRNTANRVK